MFITCLVDLVRPEVGFASLELLQKGGCEVIIPEAQTCCGQPAWNSGDAATTRPIAKQVIQTFAEFDYVVVPSGSCAGMIKIHYPELFKDDLLWQQQALSLAEKTWELTSFLSEVLRLQPVNRAGRSTVTYHDSCSGLRELGVKQQPRDLLERMGSCQLNELTDAEVCCGFGGTFCVKYGEISERIVDEKISNIESTRAEVLLGGDLGCLMNIAGRMKRKGGAVRVFHIAEFLAGHTAGDGIGEPVEDES
ncbi:MAG: L-lactate dehydrogenase complex protein LldE [Parasphingorhabdus sp.]|jgi:L-lactate dehydrogenase complex protein LldE